MKQTVIMLSASLIEKFGLAIQQKASPDGYPIYIADKLSHNGPTIFFEPFIAETDNNGPAEKVVRITKAGAVNHFIVPVQTLDTQTVPELQQAIETALPIPG
jgi:hypothetical protein